MSHSHQRAASYDHSHAIHDHHSHSSHGQHQEDFNGQQVGEDDNVDRKERDYFDSALKSFGKYRRFHLSANHRRRMNYLTLPKPQRVLLDAVGYREKLDDVDHGIRMNAEFLEEIAACGGLPFTIDESVATSTSSTSNDASATSTSATTSADQSQDRLRSTLRQFIRDWSAAGARERQECYGPVLEALEERWPDQMERKGRKVLVPGAGLGRLALEVAGRGFAAQGNEFNAHMLIASNWVLNETRSIGQFPIYPYLHSFSNHLTTRDNLLKECSIPDVLPSTVLASVDQPDFSFVAGDFEEVYGGRRSDGSWSSDDGGPPDDQRGQWDAVITVFFIDCARNVINFLKIIHGLLKEDGVWINLGPCLWHYENSVDKERGEGSVELSLDELKALAAKMGFLIEDQRLSTTTYAANSESMLRSEYTVASWVARKVLPLPSGL